MKIIFLDIDGVLNSIEHTVGIPESKQVRLYRVDPTRVGLLRWLVEQTDAKIVISSTWRYGHNLQWFSGYFEHFGWAMAPIIGMTPKIGGRRGDEIDAWIKSDKEKVGEELQYVIFDDDSDFLPTQQLIQCDPVTGLSLRNVLDAIDLLGLGANGDKAAVEGLWKHVDFRLAED